MMPVISGMTLAVSSSLAGSIIAKVTVSMALGLLAAWLARGNRAAVRHALLAATFGVMLLLPVAAVLMPPLHVGVPVEVISPTTSLPLGIGVDANSSTTTVGAGSRVAALAPHVSMLSLSNVLFAGWAAGVALLLLPVVAGLWQIRSLRQSGLPWPHGQSLVEGLALDAGIHRRVEVLLHEALPGPMTCGVVRPAILLPRDAENWTPEDLNRAIVHELEHVHRGDSVSRCLARAACAGYWFHPLVWMAWRKLVLEAERCCDDAVLRRSEATAYAEQLVGLAKRLAVARRSPLLAMANRADLATRVGAVLDSRQRRGRAGIFPMALVCGAAAALVIAVSPLTLVGAHRAQSQPFVPWESLPGGGLMAPQILLQSKVASTPQFEVASIKPASPSAPRPGRMGARIETSPGLLSARNATLKELIEGSYSLENYQVLGGPEWIDSARFDVQAKPAGGAASREQLLLMLRPLLADRFKLAFHRESKELAVYALVVAQGAKLKRYQGAEGAPLGVNRLGRNVDMASWAKYLTRFGSDLPVIDKTGLTGIYDLDLDLGKIMAAAGADFGNPSIGSVFQATVDAMEPLGLKLVRTKAPIEVLVVDHAERPSQN